MSTEKNVMIIGCGRLGSLLANRLDKEGYRIMVLDVDESAFSALAVDFRGDRIKGDPLNEMDMQKVKMKEIDLAIAATGKDDLNLIIGLVARKIFGVAHAIVRVNDPTKPTSLGGYEFGTICPTKLAADSIVVQVRSALEME